MHNRTNFGNDLDSAISYSFVLVAQKFLDKREDYVAYFQIRVITKIIKY